MRGVACTPEKSSLWQEVQRLPCATLRPAASSASSALAAESGLGGFCDANQAARLRMSSSLSVAAIGCITGLLRVPVRKNTSCHCRKPSGWPASEGVSAIWEMPAGPWQGAQVSALASPAARSTAAPRHQPRAMRLRRGQVSGSWVRRYQQNGPPGRGGPGRRILARGPRGASRSAVPPVGRIRLCRSCPHTLNPTQKNRSTIF